jgi:fructose-1,6-bisphosphatase/inositol monophosphatase family enzyme
MMHKVEMLMRQAAAEAIMPRFRRLARHEVAEKSPGEFVTAADHDAERILTAGLLALRPGSLVVGEEAAAADPAIVSRLGEGEVWLVDPLDGTANFAAGEGPFAVMVALVRNGETVAAWMLDPQSGGMAQAERGAGAVLGEAQVRAASECPPLAALRGAVFKRFLPPDLRQSIERRASVIGEMLPGLMCAGREYPAIVTGERHFALFWRALPWDHAPGALFAEEAGAMARRPDGTAYRPGDPRPGLLVAQNGDIWHAVRAALLADREERTA